MAAFGAQTFGEIPAVIRRLQVPRARAFPFVSVAQTLALDLANLRRLTRFHPDHGIDSGNIGELELVDAGLRVFRLLRGRSYSGAMYLAPQIFSNRGFA